MKKYIPIFFSIFILSLYLVSQGFFQTGDPTATPAGAKTKLWRHYEEILKTVKLKDSNGQSVNVKNKNGIIIINFWASWCTPCLEEFPSLNELVEKYEGKNLKVIGINTDEKEQETKLKKIQDKYNLKFPNVLDKSGSLISTFNINAIPISIIYHDGKVVEVSKGAKDFSSEEFLEKVEGWLN